jgi:alcohol dehydrogenase
MNGWRYHSPVEIRFGDGCREELKEAGLACGARMVWAVDPFVAGTQLLKDLAAGTSPASIWTGVRPNPTLASVRDLAETARHDRADGLVAIGGGSTIDTAKAAACVIAMDVSVEELHAGSRAPERSLPLVAMPTTAGTGSEVTPVAVLTDPERGVKAPIGGPCLYPRLALVDPEWTHTAPPQVTASTGIDALSHALEAYWGLHSQPICDALSAEATERILRALPVACERGGDADARRQVALGSLLAGMAFAQTKTAAVHACSYPLTQRFGLSHGAACGLTLDAFLRFNALAVPEKLNRLAVRVGYEDAQALASAILALKGRIGLPRTLEEAGIAEEDLDVLVAESFHANMQNNPREVTEKHLVHIYTHLGEDPNV